MAPKKAGASSRSTKQQQPQLVRAEGWHSNSNSVPILLHSLASPCRQVSRP